jgi:hypothetical protein
MSDRATVFLREDFDVSRLLGQIRSDSLDTRGEQILTIDPQTGTRSITGVVTLSDMPNDAGGRKPAVNLQIEPMGFDFPVSIDIDLLDVVSVNCGQF